MSLVIGTVKVLSMISAALFGAIGLLANYKDSTGRITKWGKIALSGIILSAVLSLTLFSLETASARRAAEKARADAEESARVLSTILENARLTVSQQRDNLEKTESLSADMSRTLGHLRANEQRTAELASGMSASLKQQQQNLAQGRETATQVGIALNAQRALLAAQGRVHRQVMRPYYPLEPVTFVYSLEYPMDQPALQGYADRVRDDIYRYLVEAREGRGVTSPDLRGEEGLFILTNREDWKPRTSADERGASAALLQDETRFSFNELEGADTSDIRFSCIPPHLADAFVTLPQKGPTSQQVELAADFQRRVFIKEVRCVNPIRTGRDVPAMSALDLVDRELTWAPFSSPHPRWTLQKIALRFANEYENPPQARYFEVPNSTSSFRVTSAFVGVADASEEIEHLPLLGVQMGRMQTSRLRPDPGAQ
jgi:hypothetical protein